MGEWPCVPGDSPWTPSGSFDAFLWPRSPFERIRRGRIKGLWERNKHSGKLCPWTMLLPDQNLARRLEILLHFWALCFVCCAWLDTKSKQESPPAPLIDYSKCSLLSQFNKWHWCHQAKLQILWSENRQWGTVQTLQRKDKLIHMVSWQAYQLHLTEREDKKWSEDRDLMQVFILTQRSFFLQITTWRVMITNIYQ